jgi:hypothetical protein
MRLRKRLANRCYTREWTSARRMLGQQRELASFPCFWGFSDLVSIYE